MGPEPVHSLIICLQVSDMKSCFFIGHREISCSLLPLLDSAVEQHITEFGVEEFIVGGYGNFDRMVTATLRKMKMEYPHIFLTLLLPYHPSHRHVIMPDGFDRSFYPPEMEKVPMRLAIVRANRYMVDHSDYLICNVWHPASNARELLEYAQRRQAKGLIHIQNIAPNGN